MLDRAGFSPAIIVRDYYVVPNDVCARVML